MLLGAMQSKSNRQNGTWLTISELADRFGVSRDTVERWIHDGRVRAVNISTVPQGGTQRISWRIDPESLEAFLEMRANRPPLPRRAKPKPKNQGIIEFIK